MGGNHGAVGGSADPSPAASISIDTADDGTAGAVPSRARPASRQRTSVEQRLSGELRHAWPLDLVNAAAAIIGVLTQSVVVWFHIIFLVLALAALVLPFKRFVVRLVGWMAVSAALVAWSVVGGHTPRVELSELPLLFAVLVLAYLSAQARGHVVQRLEATQTELVARADNELEALRHQLEQAQRLEMLGRASQSIAHDLRNVFTVVNACTADLAEEMHGRKALARVMEIANASDRGVSIVNDLLMTGRKNTVDGPVDLGDVVQHLSPLLQRLTGPRVKLRLECGPTPVRASIDRTSVLQILMNLVVNATEAIEGPGNISVSCERITTSTPSEPSGSFAVLTVVDDGPGIPADVAARMFESGYSTKGLDHSGLGLATVWRIVQRWGGRISVDSAEGRGTTVRIELPLREVASVRSAAVVLSDATARELLTAELVGRGYRVAAAAYALEACDVVADVGAIELALLDEHAADDPSLHHVARLDQVGVVVLGSEPAPKRLPRTRDEARDLLDHLLALPPLAFQ